MNEITWTDREHGRQFWLWDAKTQEWVKSQFVLWKDLEDKPSVPNRDVAMVVLT